MATERKIKWTAFNVEFADNGFILDARGNNPYGADPRQKEICTTAEQVITKLMTCVAHNVQCTAEEKARLEADKNA